MKNLKNKKIIIVLIAVVIVVGGVSGYFIYNNNRKNTIKDKMNITFTELTDVEYGTKDFNVEKELVRDIENAELVDTPTIDTTKVGELTLTFTLKKDDVTKKVEHTIKVVDTKAPEISLETENKDITVDDKYDFMSNIKSVKDEIDGDIQLDKDVIKLNKKATEEYNKLKKDDIKEDTKVADKLISEFLIEDIKDKEEKSLYLKNCYYIDGSVDASKSGEYKINVIAIDKNGNKVTKQFVVNVKPKEEKIATNSNSKSTSNTSNSGSSNNSSSTKKGNVQDVINTAYSIGNVPYVVGGTTTSGVDCNGYIYYAYTQNGYNISKNVAKAGRKVAQYSAGTGLDPSIIKAGDIIITEGYDLFGTYRYHAQLATGGDTYCDVGLTFSSSGLYEGTKIFNITVRRVI